MYILWIVGVIFRIENSMSRGRYGGGRLLIESIGGIGREGRNYFICYYFFILVMFLVGFFFRVDRIFLSFLVGICRLD